MVIVFVPEVEEKLMNEVVDGYVTPEAKVKLPNTLVDPIRRDPVNPVKLTSFTLLIKEKELVFVT